MKKLLIFLLMTVVCQSGYSQLREFILRNGNTIQMRKYDSASVASSLSTKLNRSDSINYYDFTSRWRTQHLIDSLSLAFTPVNIYNSDGSIFGNRSIEGDGGILSINYMDLAFNSPSGERIAMGGFAGGGINLIGGSSGVHSTSITVYKDSLSIRPKAGIANVDSLRSGSTSDDVMTWNNAGKWGHITMDSSLINNFHLKVKSLFSGTSPITYNSTTGAVGISQATNSTNGYLSSTDWNTFNNKLSSIDTSNISNFHLKVKSLYSGTAPITYSSTTGAISITQSTTGANGYLSSTDFNTFNNKLTSPATALQALGSSIKVEPVAGTFLLAGTSNALADGTLRLVGVYIPSSMTITGVTWYQQTQGSYTSDNYNGVGLYSYSGGTLTLVASSTDDGTIWKAASGSWNKKAFSSTYPASAGIYFIAALYNSSAQTTAPAIISFPNLPSAAFSAFDFTNSVKISMTLTGQSTLPSPSTAASGTAGTNVNFYLALY